MECCYQTKATWDQYECIKSSDQLYNARNQISKRISPVKREPWCLHHKNQMIQNWDYTKFHRFWSLPHFHWQLECSIAQIRGEVKDIARYSPAQDTTQWAHLFCHEHYNSTPLFHLLNYFIENSFRIWIFHSWNVIFGIWRDEQKYSSNAKNEKCSNFFQLNTVKKAIKNWRWWKIEWRIEFFRSVYCS